jgi:hypothetical protein
VTHIESKEGIFLRHRVTHNVLRHKESKEGIFLSPKEERTSSSNKWKNNPTTKNSWRLYYPAGRQRPYDFWGRATSRKI